jgi:hypothetical protein
MMEIERPLTERERFAVAWEDHGLGDVVPVAGLPDAISQKHALLNSQNGYLVSEIAAFSAVMVDAGLEPQERVELIALRYGVFFPTSAV